MQQSITRRDAYEPTLTATIGGRAVEADRITMDRDLPDPLMQGRLTAASGTVTAVQGADAVTKAATPWDPGTQWPPVPESSASVDMDTGNGPVSILRNGRVVSARGGTDDRAVEVEVADQYQSLDRTISWDDLPDAVPSRQEGVTARYVGLQSIAYTDKILRHCGWYSTPPALPYATLSVPAQGTMWPEVGVCETSVRRSDGAGYPLWGNAPWGVGATDVTATYLTSGGYSLADRSVMEMTAMTTTAGGGMYIEAKDSASRGLVRLSWSDSLGYLWVRDSGGTLVEAARVARSSGLLYATISRVSSTQVAVTLRSGGVVATGTATVSSIVTTEAVRQASIAGDGRGSGFQIAYPSQAGTLTTWTPSAVIYPRAANRNALKVMKSVQGENCADLLREQCEAECATYWIDETGVLRWWDLARLEAQTTVGTLTSNDDIDGAGFAWEHSLSQVRSRVAVRWSETAREWAWRTTVDLWQGSGITLQPGDEPRVQLINVPDDEVWVMPDTNLRPPSTSSDDSFNYGWYSWYGGVIDNTDTWAHTVGTLTATMERINDASFKLTTSWSGSQRVTMQTVSTEATSSLWRRRRDFDLPIMRGKGRFTLTERWTYSVQSGPATAPEHQIDGSRWIQSAEQAQYTADYAGGRLTVPQPVLSSIALIPVPGLQLGDVVDVEDTDVTRLTIRGVIVADSRAIRSGADMDHAIAIRPTLVTLNGVEWQEWGTVMANRTRTAWGTSQNSKQWQQWGAAPLAGEDTLNG